MQNEILTRPELIEKYNLTTQAKNPPFKEFETFCRLRGLIIEKVGRKNPGGMLLKVVEDLRVLPNEEWRFCENAQLWVSNLGRIKTKDHKILSTDSKVEGYVITRSNETGRYYRVHRLVMETFNPIENSQFFDVDHINGKRNDNRLENLRWVNTKENIQFKDHNQTEIGILVAKLVQKYGYNETFEKISQLLNEK